MKVIDSHTSLANGRYAGQFGDHAITSAFQPIISLSHRRAVGYEALMRANRSDGQVVPPPVVFETAKGTAECILLDRLCRHIHAGNFMNAGAPENSWLFLNVNPLVSIHGKDHGAFFKEMLTRHGLPPHRVVIEILESKIQQNEQLVAAVDYYRSLGCLIAIDDFGAGHSNFDRIWRIEPHIVKLDRSIIVEADGNNMVRRLLPRLVSMIHESGSLALMEGIETEGQALVAMDAGFDFVQGYYFGRPAAQISVNENVLTGICDSFRDFSSQEHKRYRIELQRYEEIFKNASRMIASGKPIEPACQKLIEQVGVERCYLLDMEGYQLGANFTAARHHPLTDPRFAPLADASGAIWSRKPYFRRAVDAPGEMQISRPYLSLTGANMCVTFSIMLETPNGPRVFCLDLDWSKQY